MEDSDRSTGGFDFEELRERIARRKFLIGGTALVGGLAFTNQSDTNRSKSEERLTQAEDRLAELAVTINDADLVDPRQSLQLNNDVTQVIKSVDDSLNQDLPEDPEIEQRVSALVAASEYYGTLAKTLDVAASLLTQIADLELIVLNHEGELGYDPATDFDTLAFNKSVKQLSKAEKNPDAVTSRDRKLVPEQQQVLDDLRSQRNIFESHLTAQKIYLDTAAAIEAGIRAHEKSRFDIARSALTDARKSLSSGIPNTDARYRLSSVGLSLDQYERLLRLRQKGVSKLLSVCNDSVPVQQRRSVANDALDRFFEARQIVTN